MSTPRFHYTILASCLALCAFMYLDAYVLPLQSSTEVITGFEVFTARRKWSSSEKTYQIRTSAGDFDITSTAFDNLAFNDTVILKRALITRSLQLIIHEKEGWVYTFETGFLRARYGLILVPALSIGLLLLLLFFHVIDNPKGRNNLTYFPLAFTVILFLFYLDVEIF